LQKSSGESLKLAKQWYSIWVKWTELVHFLS